VQFLLILHSKHSAILSKIHPTDCFFGDFAHLAPPLSVIYASIKSDVLLGIKRFHVKTLESLMKIRRIMPSFNLLNEEEEEGKLILN